MSIFDLAGDLLKEPEKEEEKKIVHVVKSTDDSKVAVEDFNYEMLDRFSKKDLSEQAYIAKNLGFDYDKDKKDVIKYDFEGETIRICPEPLSFLNQYNDISDDKVKADGRFRKQLETFHTMQLDYKPTYDGKTMWINKTIHGINLRPGKFMGTDEVFKPVSMNDDNVHGLVVGRTGSGKSVYINQLILSLITEYSPWELDLYLADFKKVELSRYMNDSDESNNNIEFTPHVKACAATSEIRYVISLMKNLVDRMNARNEFFTRLGVTKLKDFRNTYNVVLPRVLLIVDEFQQLFTEASSKEADELQFLLNSITKLGRATGFHLIFASQEMSGTLNSNTLANFKIRMALPCEPGISGDILGNTAAAKLSRNYILINTDSGDEMYNKKYHVPFIETEQKDSFTDEGNKKTDFFNYLDNIKLASGHYDIVYKTSTQKFYREELQEKESNYLSDLDRVRDNKNKIVNDYKSDLFDALVLGKTVLYSEKSNDKVTMYLEKGRNKGILITSPNTLDIANIRKLLLENIRRSDKFTRHVELNLNKMVNAKYSISKYIDTQAYTDLNNNDFLSYLKWLRLARINLDILMKNTELVEKVQKHVSEYSMLSNSVTELTDIEDKITEISDRINELMHQNSNNNVDNSLLRLIEYAYTDVLICNVKYDIKNSNMYAVLSENSAKIKDVDTLIDSLITYLDNNIIEWTDQLRAGGDAASLGITLINANIVKQIIIYYKERYNGLTISNHQLSNFNIDITRAYNNLEDEINNYKNYVMNKEEILELQEIKRALEEEYIDIRKCLNDQDMISRVLDMFTHNIYEQLEFKQGNLTPDIKYEVKDGNIELINNSYVGVTELIYKECVDIIEVLLGIKDTYDKYVFWINGIDEVPEYSDDLSVVITDSINYDILVIANASTQIDDIFLRRTFDYVFITGRVENLYDHYDIVYTKPALNSIVVNSIVRSKGTELPFKIYKSDEEKIDSYTFLDDLLE